jgi:disulfide bond formation protein DsbB
MTTETRAADATAAPRSPLWSALDRKAAGLALVLGLAAILAALASQYLGGLQPCELCLEQRLAYYFGLPVLAAVLILWNRLPTGTWFLLLAVVAAIFAWGAGLGIYHAGVEYGFWPGPTACSGTGTGISFEDLGNLRPVIPCDKVQFQLFGVSLAGMNALVSLAVVGLLLVAMAARWRRVRRD